MKFKSLGIIAGLLFGQSMAAQAALIQVDLTTNGNDWYYVDYSNPDADVLIPQSPAPEVYGSMIIDNERTDESAIQSFNFTFGEHNWSNELGAEAWSPHIADDGIEGDVFSFNADGILLGISDLYFVLEGDLIGGATRQISISSGLYSGMGSTEITTPQADYLCFNYCYTFTQSAISTPTPTDVPEPGTLALFGLGCAGLAFMRKPRKS